jgi:hypothetical protein
MPIEFPCPHCGVLLKVPDHLDGTDGKCRACRMPITAPPGDELCRAAFVGNVAWVQALLAEGREPNGTLPAAYGKTPIYWAARQGHAHVVRLLLERGADVHRGAPLHTAVRCGQVEVASLLLQSGASVKDKDSAGCTVKDSFYKDCPHAAYDAMFQLLRQHGAWTAEVWDERY